MKFQYDSPPSNSIFKRVGILTHSFRGAFARLSRVEVLLSRGVPHMNPNTKSLHGGFWYCSIVLLLLSGRSQHDEDRGNSMGVRLQRLEKMPGSSMPCPRSSNQSFRSRLWHTPSLNSLGVSRTVGRKVDGQDSFVGCDPGKAIWVGPPHQIQVACAAKKPNTSCSMGCLTAVSLPL